jgi:hypothetical protein
LSPTAYLGFSLSLWTYSPKIEFSAAVAIDPSNKWLSTEGNAVTAIIKGVTAKVFTQYDGIVPPNLDPVVKEKANNLIAMVGLNKTVPGDSKITDRRMINRTVVFFETIQAFTRLQLVAIQQKGDTGQLYLILLTQVFATARYSGFYEIWACLFYLLSQVGDLKSVYKVFKENSCNPQNPEAYFAGTDKNCLP